MINTILFTFTFIFGTLRLLSYTQIFKASFPGILDLLVPVKLSNFIKWLDNVIIFYACIAYQVWFWFSFLKII